MSAILVVPTLVLGCSCARVHARGCLDLGPWPQPPGRWPCLRSLVCVYCVAVTASTAVIMTACIAAHKHGECSQSSVTRVPVEGLNRTPQATHSTLSPVGMDKAGSWFDGISSATSNATSSAYTTVGSATAAAYSGAVRTLGSVFTPSPQPASLCDLDFEACCVAQHEVVIGDDLRASMEQLADEIIAEQAAEAVADGEGSHGMFTILKPRLEKQSNALLNETYDVTWQGLDELIDPHELIDGYIEMIGTAGGVVDEPEAVRSIELRLRDRVRFHRQGGTQGRLLFEIEPCHLMTPLTRRATDGSALDVVTDIEGAAGTTTTAEAPAGASTAAGSSTAHAHSPPDVSASSTPPAGQSSSKSLHEVALRSLALSQLRLELSAGAPSRAGKSTLSCTISLGLRVMLPMPWWLPRLVVSAAGSLLLRLGLGEVCSACVQGVAEHLCEQHEKARTRQQQEPQPQQRQPIDAAWGSRVERPPVVATSPSASNPPARSPIGSRFTA